eukprot:8200045-Pyramimonas_sp.AAC.1
MKCSEFGPTPNPAMRPNTHVTPSIVSRSTEILHQTETSNADTDKEDLEYLLDHVPAPCKKKVMDIVHASVRTLQARVGETGTPSARVRKVIKDLFDNLVDMVMHTYDVLEDMDVDHEREIQPATVPTMWPNAATLIAQSATPGASSSSGVPHYRLDV